MRVLNVTQTYYPFVEFGGPPVKVRALSRNLARRGHQVTVLTADWGFEQRLLREKAGDAKAERGRFGWRLVEEGVESVYLPTRWRYRALTWNPKVREFCRARLREFDVVHIFGLYDLLGPAAASACRANGIPYVVEPIGMFLPIVRSFWPKRMYHLLLGKRMLRESRLLIATSEQEMAELASQGVAPEKIALRRNGVEIPEVLPERGVFRRAHNIPDEAKLILFLGRLSRKKNPELLLEAFAILCTKKQKEKGGEMSLVFAGPDEEGIQARLTRRAEMLGIGSKVRLCGPIYGEAKWSAYRDADVFVLPSQNENFGNSAAESIVAGTPVIVSEKCGIAPMVKDVAGLVAPLDAPALAQATEKILFDEEVRRRLIAGCRELALRLDWGEPAREMEVLYARLRTSRAAPVPSARIKHAGLR